MEISLSPELERWIREMLESGRYSCANEIVEEAIRALRRESAPSVDLTGFNEELERRLSALDRGEWDDPAVVRAELERKSAERRRKTA